MTTATGLGTRRAPRRVASAPLNSATVGVTVAGLGMVVSAAVDLLGDGGHEVELLLPGLALVLVGLAVRTRISVPQQLPARSVFSAVAAGWVAACLAGAIPYLTTGSLDRFDDALFESVAGFTTTAASVIPNVQALSDGVLFWRALTQWIGGLGVIVLAVSVLPYLGVGGMSLLRGDLPPASQYLATRVSQTGRRLWRIYAAFSVLMAVVYLALGMDLLDAVAHALTTVSTGGFSTRTGGFASFDSASLEWAAVVGMFLAGTNIVLIWWALRGRPATLLRSAEARAYVMLIVTASAAVAAWNAGDTAWSAETIRHSVFTVVSVVSTTGFVVADFGRWVQTSQTVLVLLMLIGAMSASAGGGSKILRILAVRSLIRRETARHIHRRLVAIVRVGRDPVPEEVVSRILGYYAIFFMAIVAGSLAVASFDIDLVTAMSSVISSMANVGPALGAVSPGGSYLNLDAGARAISMFLMLLGRVEIYPVILGLAGLAEAVQTPRPGRRRRRATNAAAARARNVGVAASS